MEPRSYLFETELCRAISVKHAIEIRYKDDVQSRIFEPYVVFMEPGIQNVTVAGWQVMNPNKPLDLAEWRKFTVGLISDLKILAGTFSPDLVFSSFDAKVYGLNVLCAVDR